jgi:hypothetical protein
MPISCGVYWGVGSVREDEAHRIFLFCGVVEETSVQVQTNVPGRSVQMLIIRMQLLLGFVTTFELLSLFLVFVLQTTAQCSRFELSHQGSMDATQTSGQRLIADLRKYSSALFLHFNLKAMCLWHLSIDK